MTRSILAACSLLVASLSFAGCGGSMVEVSGNVTVGMQPLANGQIAFAPADGGGTPVGASIVAGKYKAKMMPGEKTVLITETLDIPVVASTEEMQRMAAEGKVAAPPPPSLITPQTKGNSSKVTVTKGTSTLNFKLEVK